MQDHIIKSVHKVAKAICKSKGWQSTPSLADVEIVLMAAEMLIQEWEAREKE